MRPLLLDLFCCAGCGARGYDAAGFDVVGVDIKPQSNYPYAFLQMDALEALARLGLGESLHFTAPQFGQRAGYFRLSDFAKVHASPPCQGYSGMHNARKDEHPRLIAPTRDLLDATGLAYTIENVEGARSELRDPVTLHGWNFGLNVARKRLFETNWELPAPDTWLEPERSFLIYDHGHWFWTKNVPVFGKGGRKAVEYWPMAMGLGETWDDCPVTRDELAEGIPPAFTQYIGGRFLQACAEAAA